MICPKCKKENTSNIKWCCYCGSLLRQPQTDVEHNESSLVDNRRPTERSLTISEEKRQNRNTKGCPNKKQNKKRRQKNRRCSALLWIIILLLVFVAIFALCMIIIFSPHQFIHNTFRIKSANVDEFEGIMPGGYYSDGKQLVFHQSEAAHVVKNDSLGRSFIDNEILLSFDDTVDINTVLAAVAPYGGTVVGINEYLNTYQILFDRIYTYDELISVSEEIESKQPTADATPNYYIPCNLAGYKPNDREWINEWGDYPAGKNWGPEAIHAPEMWEYYMPLEKVTTDVGVLDNQFYTEHEDLVFQEAFLNNYDSDIEKPNHGTFVCGIIAASFNNDLGIAGIARNVNLYGTSYIGVEDNPDEYTSDGTTIFCIESGLSYLIGVNRCKVINLSLQWGFANDDDIDTVRRAQAKHMEKQIKKLINKGYDFLIVKASGNDRKDYSTQDLFATIDDPQILDRIIVIGAAELGDCGDGKQFHLWPDSNYGSAVDIIAPGSHVYSTVRRSGWFGNVWSGYDSGSGTSFAAPQVSGTAAAIWSAFPNLTGPQMKQILCDTAQGSYGYATEIAARYPMLDAYAAIQKAAEIVQESKPEQTNDKKQDKPNSSSSFSHDENADISKPLVVDQTVSEEWSEVYRKFVLNQNVTYEDYGPKVLEEKTFTVHGLQFFKGPFYEPKFSLYDMDGNGVPELVIFNGDSSMAGAVDHVFTCVDGQVQYLGKIGFRGCELYYYDGLSHSGLYCSDGNNGVINNVYYYLRDGTIISEVIDSSSVGASGTRIILPFYTIGEIRSMGWENFVLTVMSRFPKSEQVSIQAHKPELEPEVTPGAIVEMDDGQQYAANIFLSNFSEQGAFERNGFDINNPNYDELVQFVYLYCKINRHNVLGVAQELNSYFYTITMDTVNNVLYRHFGITMTEEQASQIQGECKYMNGAFYYPAADGESYNKLTVVNKMESCEDGTYHLYFDIYSLSREVYGNNNGAVDNSYYYRNKSSAEADPNLTSLSSGQATVRPYENDGIQTFQLVSYTVY